MAYMSQAKKKELAPGIKAVLKKYGMKGTLSVSNHMKLVCTLKSGEIDLLGNAISFAEERGDEISIRPAWSVNHYWLGRQFSGKARDFMTELKAAMMVGNHDRSDVQSDYFDVGWYIDIYVGSWDKPYVFTGELETA